MIILPRDQPREQPSRCPRPRGRTGYVPWRSRPHQGTVLFALFGYCLMSNHFHLLLKPAPGQSISRILQSLTVAHTWRHHRRQGTSGHVWQGRFRSPVIQDGDHLLVVLRYIEANPVRAAMVADPCESTCSSHRCHGAGHADPILDSFPEWEQLGRTEPERRARWRRKVRGEQPAKELDGVRSSVRSGRPYGAEDWVEVISHRLGIVREPRRRGRPPREKMLCRVGKGRPAGSIELRVFPSPSKIPYGGFSPVRLQMDRQWRPSTTSRGLSAVHIRPMRPSYTPPQLQLPGIRDPRRDYPFENLSVQCGTTPNN